MAASRDAPARWTPGHVEVLVRGVAALELRHRVIDRALDAAHVEQALRRIRSVEANGLNGDGVPAPHSARKDLDVGDDGIRARRGARRRRGRHRECCDRDTRDEGGSDGAPSSDDRLVYARPQMPILVSRHAVGRGRPEISRGRAGADRDRRGADHAAAQPNGTGDTHGAPGLSVFASAMVLLRRTVGQGRSVRTRSVAGSGQENDDRRLAFSSIRGGRVRRHMALAPTPAPSATRCRRPERAQSPAALRCRLARRAPVVNAASCALNCSAASGNAPGPSSR